MTAHGLTMLATIVAFFGLLLFGVVVAGLTPGTAFLASLGTLTLIGVGVMFTTVTFRRDDDRNRRP
jgi:fatty acid desaturase